MALPTSGLIINLDAHSFQPPDARMIDSWLDESGSGNTPVFSPVDDGQPGVQPYYTATGTAIGGPAVQFSNGSLKFAANTQFDSSTGAEIFVVLRCVADSTDNPGFYQMGGNDWTYFPYTDNYIYDGSFTNSRFSFAAVSPSSWHVYNVSHDGSARVTRIDGSAVLSVSAPFVPPSQASKSIMRIGRTQGVPWQGLIAGFIAYNRVLTASERTDALTYMQQRHLIAAPASSPEIADIPAAAVTLDVPVTGSDPVAPDPVAVVPAAALLVDVNAQASNVLLSAVAPLAGETVLTPTPTFAVAVTAPDPDAAYTVEIQYASSTGMTAAVTLSRVITGVDGGARITAATAVPNTTYWRARLLSGGVEEVGWSTVQQFTVLTAGAPATLPVSWVVDAAAVRPLHLWHFDPDGPVAGDTITIYGQGFPGTGTLLYGDAVLPTTTWQKVPATSANSDNTARTIDGGTVTCEHYEITFTAPADDGTGAALTLEA